MTDYTGSKCPVCGRAFAAHDDIVVCPECGAPYHRACYVEAGKCVFADKHGAHYTWAPPQAETDGDAHNDEHVRHCPRCGCPNSEHALFCQHCGMSLSANQQGPYGFPQNGEVPPYGTPGDPNQPNGFPTGGIPDAQIPFIFDPMGGVNPNEPIDGIPAGDLAKLVQNNTQYYLPTFMNQRKFGHNRFNFSAFLFSGGWMLYRKQYRLGTIITSVMAALYLLSMYVTVTFTSPLYSSLMQQAGIASDSFSPTYAQLLQMSELLYQQTWDKIIWFCLPTFISIIQFVIMLITGFNGNKWYLKHCVKKVEKIRQETQTTAENAIRLQEEGGVNTALAICLLICYMIISVYIPNI
jgi:Protein of unknown function (DUF2628).